MSKRPRRQCAKCPWKVGTDPRSIPHGYCEIEHAGLRSTIAGEPDVQQLLDPLRIMACHESIRGKDLACVGWMENQLGPGNNLALRLAVMTGRIDGNIETVGLQHARFEDTLP